jgi:uncharacterized zinc-type alcohol dehydrogenase-like protein
MSKTVKCYIAHAADSPLVPGEITRRACGPKDISIKTVYAGICHSDLHTVRGEWQGKLLLLLLFFVWANPDNYIIFY